MRELEQRLPHGLEPQQRLRSGVHPARWSVFLWVGLLPRCRRQELRCKWRSQRRAGETIVLDTDAFPAGYSFSSLAVAQGGVLTATGSNPLIITVDTSVDIQGHINLNGGKGGNSAGDHKAAGGGAGGGALRIQAATINVGSSGAITVDGGDGGDGGADGQGFFPNSYSDEVAGDGSGGVGIAGGFNGGAGGASNQDGFPGEGPGASQGSPTSGGVPPGAGGAGHAWYVEHGVKLLVLFA